MVACPSSEPHTSRRAASIASPDLKRPVLCSCQGTHEPTALVCVRRPVAAGRLLPLLCPLPSVLSYPQQSSGGSFIHPMCLGGIVLC